VTNFIFFLITESNYLIYNIEAHISATDTKKCFACELAMKILNLSKLSMKFLYRPEKYIKTEFFSKHRGFFTLHNVQVY
jgi:hypothetical protein